MNLARVATLLASGLKPLQVSTIVGCSPARISQLLKEPGFELLLAEQNALQSKSDIEETALSAKYNAAEHLLVNQVMEMAPVSELRDVTAALRVVAERQEKMKARTNPIQNTPAAQVVVSITLPSHAIPGRVIEMTSNKEVISVGEQTLAPLSSTAVTNLFSSLKGGKQNEPSTGVTSPKESIASNPEEESFLTYAAT